MKRVGFLGSCFTPYCGGIDGYFCVRCRHYVTDCLCEPGMCECPDAEGWASTGERASAKARVGGDRLRAVPVNHAHPVSDPRRETDRRPARAVRTVCFNGKPVWLRTHPCGCVEVQGAALPLMTVEREDGVTLVLRFMDGDALVTQHYTIQKRLSADYVIARFEGEDEELPDL